MKLLVEVSGRGRSFGGSRRGASGADEMGRPAVGYGLRARGSIWPPVRLARLRCERESVCPLFCSAVFVSASGARSCMRQIGLNVHQGFCGVALVACGLVAALFAGRRNHARARDRAALSPVRGKPSSGKPQRASTQPTINLGDSKRHGTRSMDRAGATRASPPSHWRPARSRSADRRSSAFVREPPKRQMRRRRFA